MTAGDSTGFIHFIHVKDMKKAQLKKTVDTKSNNTPILCMESF